MSHIVSQSCLAPRLLPVSILVVGDLVISGWLAGLAGRIDANVLIIQMQIRIVYCLHNVKVEGRTAHVRRMSCLILGCFFIQFYREYDYFDEQISG